MQTTKVKKIGVLDTEHVAMKTSTLTLIINIVLSAFKLFAGIIAHSGAMVSDAIHSASDAFSTIIVMISLKLSGKEKDANHQYGHERFECVASILLAVMLAATGVFLGYEGIIKVTSGSAGIETPGALALIAAVVSIVVKEWMYFYTAGVARRINSTAMMADAWHHHSDALSSIGSLVGVGGAMLGFPVLDTWAGIIIAGFIIKAAYDIFKDAINKMTDTACDIEVARSIHTCIRSVEGVISVDLLKTRMFGSRIYVDVEIAADGSLSLTESHAIAENVHDAIEDRFPLVKHCMVHVNPK